MAAPVAELGLDDEELALLLALEEVAAGILGPADSGPDAPVDGGARSGGSRVPIVAVPSTGETVQVPPSRRTGDGVATGGPVTLRALRRNLRHGSHNQKDHGRRGGPGIGLDLLRGPAGGLTFAEEIAVAARRYEYPSGKGGPRGDEMLRQISERQGYDGKPRVVSKEDMDAYLDEEIYAVELHRGVKDGWDWVEMAKPGREIDDIPLSATAINERFRRGDLHYGTGQFGNGTYGSTSPEIAGEYAGTGGAVVRMALHPDARVVAYRDLLDEQEQFLRSLPADSAARRVYADIGRYAAARGWDAITASGMRGSTEYNVLNRTALVVQEA